ncbi:MAG: alpha/beta hydrolase [Acidimicrobiia bacterium]|nr:alpha/beta hydrolase [Acidimicrobiia bacterium]
MAMIAANGIEICYEDSGGTGEPLLLVMGLGGQLTDWPAGFVDALIGRGFRVIRFDNRDIGLSTEFDWPVPSKRQLLAGFVANRPVEAGYRVPDMAADTAGLLDALSIDSAHVVGVSMGAMIAQTMGFEHRSKVRSLTSIMSNTGDRRNGRADGRVMIRMARAPRVTRSEAPLVATEMYSMWAGSSWDRAEHLARAERAVARSWRPHGVERQTAAIAASPDRTPGLATVTAPTLVIHGLEDRLVQPSGGVATCEAVPGSRLVLYPDMGHDLPRTRWEEMTDEITVNARRADGVVSEPVRTLTVVQPGQ